MNSTFTVQYFSWIMPLRKTQDRWHEFHCFNRLNSRERKEKHTLTGYSAHYEELLFSSEVRLSSFNTEAIQLTLVLLHLGFLVRSNFKRRPIKSSGKEYLEVLPWV